MNKRIHSSVIPAQAGIQQKQISRVADSHNIFPLRGDYSIIWIPACAGMTA
jgi:hypothetical protein